jgi:hypothetical protein
VGGSLLIFVAANQTVALTNKEVIAPGMPLCHLLFEPNAANERINRSPLAS